MIEIKVMRRGNSWIGQIRCPVVPRVDEIVQMGSKELFRVETVMYEWGDDGNCHPFLIFDAEPLPRPQ